jgi:DNA-binding transcriptional LysR family regulator
VKPPLLVRTRAGYVLTPRALAIQPQLALATSHLRNVFQQQTLDLKTEARTVRLAATDTQTVLFLPGLMKRLAVEAPGVDVRVEPVRSGALALMESGALDFLFALTSTQLPTGVYSEVVFDDRLALVMRARHPAAKRKWSLADYGKYDSVGVALTGDGHSEIDALLAAEGVARRIALTTPHFMAALAAMAETDLVTTLSAALARRFAPAFGLILRKPPFADSGFQMTLVCSHVRAADPFLVWFRSLVREVARASGGRG